MCALKTDCSDRCESIDHSVREEPTWYLTVMFACMVAAAVLPCIL